MEKGRADPLFDPYYWRKIIKVLVLNIITTLVIILILLGGRFAKGSLSDIIKKFQTEITVTTSRTIEGKTRTTIEKMPLSPFFKPIREFFEVSTKQPVKSKLFDNLITSTLIEEIVYRAPIRLLIGFVVFFRKETHWLVYIAYWSIGLFLNYHWATSIHTSIEPLLWIPVFFAGIPWLWLVIRTNRLWPAIFCHAAANLSIYFAVKVYQFLY